MHSLYYLKCLSLPFLQTHKMILFLSFTYFRLFHKLDICYYFFYNNFYVTYGRQINNVQLFTCFDTKYVQAFFILPVTNFQLRYISFSLISHFYTFDRIQGQYWVRFIILTKPYTSRVMCTHEACVLLDHQKAYVSYYFLRPVVFSSYDRAFISPPQEKISQLSPTCDGNHTVIEESVV